jgi:hypothetical protein
VIRRRIRDLSRAAILPPLLLISVPVEAAAFRIEPGPVVMSEEENAIAADPARGIQHGVILILETERDDPIRGYAKTTFHLRAKILSSEARSLGDILIPYDANTGYLRKWWGRTICPDGTVHELSKKGLERETVVKSRGVKVESLKGALPGIEPGCVIDYGWVIQDRSFRFYRRIPLQRPWPIREFRYRWLPAAGMFSQFVLRRTPGFALVRAAAADGAAGEEAASGPRVRLRQEEDHVVIEGWDLPAYEDEPWGPPEDLVRASVILHYVLLGSGDTVESFWSDHARREENLVREFLFFDKGLEETLTSMDLPGEASLGEKLELVHDWIAVNIRNLSHRTSEEREAEADRKIDRKSQARRVLEAGEGYASEVDRLFIGFARALGADARVVMAPDRTDGHWDPSLLSSGQLSERAVAVRDPADPSGRITFTDPCSGLPYGQVPWWLTPSKGLLAGKEGVEEILLPISDPRQNILHSQARISWNEKGGPAVKWNSVGGGQRGFISRRALRGMNPEDRQERIERLCGGGPEFELSLAEAPAWNQLHADFQIRCEGEMTEFTADEIEEEIMFSPAGRWFPDLPSFTQETRVQPVIFDFPFIDMSVVDVEVPEGLEPGELPEPVKFSTPFTSYALSAQKTEDGIRVQRACAVVKTAVAPEEYGTLRRFFQDVETADRTKLVFRKKEGQP